MEPTHIVYIDSLAIDGSCDFMPLALLRTLDAIGLSELDFPTGIGQRPWELG